MTEFAYPSSVHFECQQCGDCCRGWEVAVSEPEKQSLEAMDWGELSDLAGLTKTLRVGGKKGYSVLARKDDGACVFLSAENRCRVHERYGEAAKPLMCRIYPFGFRRVGDTVGVDVSFVCRSVHSGTGPGLETRRSEWMRLVEEQTRIELEPRLSSKFALEPSVLWELEHQLVEFLHMEEMPLIRRLWCIHEFIKLATTGDPGTDAAATLRGAMAKALPGQLRSREMPRTLDKTERAIIGQWLYLMLNPVPVGFHQRSASARNKMLRDRDEASEAFMNRKLLTVDNQGREVSFDRIEAVSAGILADARGDRIATRYLAAKILGQRFLEAGGDVVSFREAVPRWLLGYATLLFSARWVACEAGRQSVEAEDLGEAIKMVDRTLGRVSLAPLKKAQRKAWDFVLLETDAPIALSVGLIS